MAHRVGDRWIRFQTRPSIHQSITRLPNYSITRFPFLAPLLCERIGSHLKLHELARRPLTPFGVKRRARRVSAEDRLALPAAIGVVNPSVHALGEKAHWIRHAE